MFVQSVDGRACSRMASSADDHVRAPFQIPFGNVTHPYPYPQGIVQAKVPLDIELFPSRFFLITATGVCDLILAELGEYFSSCLRVKTSAAEDAVRCASVFKSDIR